MRRRKNHTTLFDSILNAVFRVKNLYILVLTFLLATYPSSVTDGMRSIAGDEVNLRIPFHYKTHGIDLSHHNGEVNWEKISSHSDHLSSVKFCFIKATEGTDLIDPKFAEHWESLKKHKIKRGAYHFFNPSSDPRLQALNYILSVKLEDEDFYPVLDWEVVGNGRDRRNIESNVKIWLDVIEKHYGVKPIIYTNRFIYRDYITKSFSEYPLWISQYEVPSLEGYDMSNVFFWQYSMKGKMEGIETNVDFNVFMKDDFQIEKVTLRQ